MLEVCAKPAETKTLEKISRGNLEETDGEDRHMHKISILKAATTHVVASAS